MSNDDSSSNENQSSTVNTGESFSLDDMQRTYTGLLDDVMIRYSSEYLSDDFFNKMIAKNVFFGGGLYINVTVPGSSKKLRQIGSQTSLQ